MSKDHKTGLAGQTGAEIEAPIPDVRYLRHLVTALAVVMCGGMIAIVTLLWVRLGAAPVMPVLPDTIQLPQGESVSAVTFSSEWTVVVTKAGEILLYDKAGTLKEQLRP